MTASPITRRPTMRQVAARAGVSQQTVSRYLKGQGGLKPRTVSAIESAIADLDYHPDLAARSMRTGRADAVAVALPGLPRSNVYQRELTAACEVAERAGFRVEIVLSDGGPEARTAHLTTLLTSGRVDGALSLAPLSAMDPPDPRIVVAVELDEDMRNIGALADGSTAGEIVAHLADLGHRDFLHVSGDATYVSGRNRAAAYDEAIIRLGLRSHGVVGHSWVAEAGYDAVAALPDDTPVTAIVASHDAPAAGAVRCAFERGWSVPQRLSVFGWGDQVISRYGIPTLSTVAVDRETRGRHAMERLVAAVRGLPAPEAPTTRLNTLVLRESTAAPGAPPTRRPARVLEPSVAATHRRG